MNLPPAARERDTRRSGGGVAEKAVFYVEREGDKAQAEYANGTAEGYYREVLDRLHKVGRAQEAAQLNEKLGAVLYAAARFDEVLVVLNQSAEMYRALEDL